jgi:hypothetical protein
MFDPIHLAYAAAGLVIGWIAHMKVCDRHSFNLYSKQIDSPKSPASSVDPLDSIIEMIKAEQERKSKLDQLRDILTPKA